ncbi:MAG: serine hydrolase [Thermomicrobiales bacterium]
MSKVQFPRSTPEAQGIASSGILAFLEAVESGRKNTHPLDAMQSIMILRHGNVVAEGWWEPYKPELPHMLFSLSKSFTSSAIGIAVAEGLLSVDDPVLKFFPDDAPAEPSDNLKAMTVKHLLSMNTGHHEDTTGAVWRNYRGVGEEADNWPRTFLSLPVEHEPGTWFVYNTAATYMLSAIITQLTGEFLIDYLRPRLFDPLGIEHPTWDADPQGRSIGGSGLHITTDDIARFVQMYLQQGAWNGQQILTPEWVAEATAATSDNSNTQTNPDWTVGYGYQFWRCRHNAYRGDGAFGQYGLVLPEQDTTIAITSGLRDMQEILDLVWEHLLPAIHADALPDDAAAQQALEKKLASLSLPVPSGAATSPRAEALNGTTFTLAENDLQARTLAVQADADGVTLTVVTAEETLAVTARHGAWVDGQSAGRGQGEEPVAASAAWTDDETLEVRICFTESETCLIVRVRVTDGGITLEVDPNVAWGDGGVTSITGTPAA